MNTVRAVALFSGGLDSILSVLIIRKLGVEVVPIHFNHVFLHKDEYVRTVKSLNLNVVEVDITKDFFNILLNPKFGYGKNLNPCIDCKILYFKKAKEFMDRIKADFMVSGEVVGQRPFSQRNDAIKLIEKEAGVSGMVIRPLTQKNLPPTVFEEKRIIEREKLFSIKGRGRKIQLNLARDFGLKYIPSPAGGCLLTSKEFSMKVKDLIKKNLLSKIGVEILKNGRYFSVSSEASVVISRNEKESFFIDNIVDFPVIKPIGSSGPYGVVMGKLSDFSIVFRLLNRHFKNRPEKYLVRDNKKTLEVENKFPELSDIEIKKMKVY